MGARLGGTAVAVVASVAVVTGAIVTAQSEYAVPPPPPPTAAAASPPLPPAVPPLPADVPPVRLAAPPEHQAAPQAGQRAEDAAQDQLSSANLGVEVFDRTTGSLVTSQNADQQYPCMSVVKLFIAVDVLDHSPGGVPDPDTADQLRRMLRHSDDQLASSFWQTGGGPEVINRTVQRLGLTGTQPPPADPSEWGDTLTTPQDMVTLYRHVTDQMPPPARDLVVDALAHTTPTAGDGFPQLFGIASGLGRLQWAVKQGWGTSGSEAAMDSTGLVGPHQRYVVVLLGTAPASAYTSLTGAVTAAAKSLAGTLGSPPS